MTKRIDALTEQVHREIHDFQFEWEIGLSDPGLENKEYNLRARNELTLERAYELTSVELLELAEDKWVEVVAMCEQVDPREDWVWNGGTSTCALCRRFFHSCCQGCPLNDNKYTCAVEYEGCEPIASLECAQGMLERIRKELADALEECAEKT